MDERGKDQESLTSRIEQLQQERDELRKDIEQLCMQQAGPSYLAVATRMHFQRTAGLEQEIESVKKKLAVVTRDKQNLEEELAEVYRIKSQLADLHSAEVLKNKEAEKQLKFFQSSVAAAFAERDHSLMESEKAREQEEAMSQKLIDSENRVDELQSAFLEEKKVNAALQMELENLKEQTESFHKIVNKFYEIRERDTGFCAYKTWQDKCLCLLGDPPDKWRFSADSETSTSKYIASLEEELETLRKSMDKLQSNMRMGLEIEHHLRRNVKALEKKQVTLDNIIRSGLSALCDFHSQHRIEVMKILDEETAQMKSMFVEVDKMIGQIRINSDLKFEAVHKEKECNDAECRDVHIPGDVIDSSVSAKKDGLHIATLVTKKVPDESDALSQALQEKVATLLLLSQQEERHLLERDMNRALQKKVEDLQINLIQVTNEKVKALMELAQLKQQYELSPENSGRVSNKSIVIREQEGKLRNILKTTYLKRWIGKDSGEHESDFHGSNNDFARLKVENAVLLESMANLEHLTSSTFRLRLSLLKAQEAAISTSSIAIEAVIEALDGIIAEANQVKTALSSSLPVSLSANAAEAASLCGSLYEPTEPSAETPKSRKVNPVSAAGMEMVELLIIAAQLMKKSTNQSVSPED